MKWFTRRCPITPSLQKALENYMATVTDVQNALTAQATAFDTLVTAAKAAYAAATTGAATPAQLDGIVSTITAQTAVVSQALGVITTLPAA